MPESHLYGDQGTNTLQHLSLVNRLFTPTLAKLELEILPK